MIKTSCPSTLTLKNSKNTGQLIQEIRSIKGIHTSWGSRVHSLGDPGIHTTWGSRDPGIHVDKTTHSRDHFQDEHDTRRLFPLSNQFNRP